MVERIFDPRVLDTASGRFTLYVDVPERYNLPLNPDGTKPQITIAVEAENLGLAVTGMKILGGEEEMMAQGILSTALDRIAEGDLVENVEAYADLYQAIEHDEEFDTDSPVFEQFGKFIQQYTGWETTGVAFTFVTEDGEHEVEFTITSPGYPAAVGALRHVTTDKGVLNTLVSSAMPTLSEYEDEEYYYGNYDEDEDY